MKRVAVIGAGIAGLAAAHRLQPQAKVTLFEAGQHFGGHAHTVDVRLEGIRHGVDTGFLVFNHRTYPHLVQLFAELGVETAPSEMSFSVQAPRPDGRPGLEWSGSSLATVFAQKRNLASPRFLGMLADLLRFNRLTTALATQGNADAMTESIAGFLDRNRFGRAFREGYLLPMIGCIWSCPTEQMLRFPIATLIRFCHNHGLLTLTHRPQWHTVRGGSRHYVEKIVAGLGDKRLATPVRRVRRVPPGSGASGVWVDTDSGSECFDDVVMACHSDQSLALLPDASPEERSLLGAIRYQRNRTVLHTDTTVLPSRRAAWAAWNYARAIDTGREQARVCLHYLIDRLQPLPWKQPVIVSLNPDPARPPAPASVLGEWDVEHPVFDLAAIEAQKRLPSIQGRAHVWFCGAWVRYGFHEDGLVSALAAVQGLQQQWLGSETQPRQAA
ncbi:MAG: NAD(P)/FAD-dependent oxidoreductase [Rubrivivax sp.]